MTTASALAGVKRRFGDMATDLETASAPSRQNTPPPTGSLQVPGSDISLSTNRTFDSESSIVLTGVRGAGKSTLAVIAATALKARVVELEKAFQEDTSLTSTTYKKNHGAAAYSEKQCAVLRVILRRHQKGAVIVCSWVKRGIQALLLEFASTNPVIYITRDAKAIQSHLPVLDDDKVRHLLDVSGSVFRRCTHFEFFNISEDTGQEERLDQWGTQPTPYLALKRTENHFLKFLSLVLPKGTIPFIESAFPLASLPTESRNFTYAMSIRLATLLEKDIEIEELEMGADAIEIVVDDLLVDAHQQFTAQVASGISRAISHIRRSIVVPILYHVVLPESALASESGIASYLAYASHGLRLALDYISVDLRLGDGDLALIRRTKGGSKLMGHINRTEPSPPPWTDPVWLSYYHKARSLGCGLVRLTRRAEDFKSNFDASQFRGSIEQLGGLQIPLIAYNTGPRGKHSAFLNRILTSVRPEGFSESPGGEGSQYLLPTLTASEATQALYASYVHEPMKLYVVGGVVGYSLSPAMHNAALAACGIPHVYKPYSTGSISDVELLANDPYFAGASIGLPFKVEIIGLTTTLSRHAKAIGAANTLIPIRHFNQDGSVACPIALHQSCNRPGPVRALYGENTDWIGIRACLRRGLSPANAIRSSSCGLVIGAGGMARAAVYAILQLGVKNIAIINRVVSNAEKLVAHFTALLATNSLPLLSNTADETAVSFHVIKSRHDPWPSASLSLPTMVVSCIPTHAIGDVPAPDFTLPPAWLGSPTGGVVLEVAYKTLTTPLLQQSRLEAHRGWVTMDGLDLLPEQGFAQFELFTGRRAPRRVMRREVFRAYPCPDEDNSEDGMLLRQRLKKAARPEGGW